MNHVRFIPAMGHMFVSKIQFKERTCFIFIVFFFPTSALVIFQQLNFYTITLNWYIWTISLQEAT